MDLIMSSKEKQTIKDKKQNDITNYSSRYFYHTINTKLTILNVV